MPQGFLELYNNKVNRCNMTLQKEIGKPFKVKARLSCVPYICNQDGGFDDSPLWNHVKVTGGGAGGGGNRHWMCNYCNKKVTGSYSKVKGHLLAIPLCGVTACNNLSAEIMKAIKEEHDDAERRKNICILEARKQADYLTLSDGSDLLQNKKQKASGPLEKAFNVDPMLQAAFPKSRRCSESLCRVWCIFKRLWLFQPSSCGDKFDIDGHALTELAELSLDEPEIEAVTFDDNVEKQPVEVDELGGAQNLDVDHSGDEMDQNSRGKWTPRGEAYAVVAVQRNVLSLNLQRKYGGHEAHKKN
ncbi:hypothetical protein RJ640_021498 [Escallonia rubra]|uniref:BED-type domain-containing protein n=1 Tax=Escallonia rubra TaxID=112253 RepID=A0AA88QJR6_9ASTE|nr:hypothetical protein RJ640_021498 [Escallonia rubra]